MPAFLQPGSVGENEQSKLGSHSGLDPEVLCKDLKAFQHRKTEAREGDLGLRHQHLDLARSSRLCWANR
jgi:hypothetical protein